MKLTLSEEQEMLKKTARDFLATECPPKLVKEMEQDNKGYPSELWNKIAELGWLGLVFPEKYGGGGSNFLSLIVVLEEMGRVCLPGPFSPTVIGGLAILDVGSEEQKQEFLPAVSQGKLILGLGLTEPVARYDPAAILTEAKPDKDHYVINGAKIPIPYAHVTDFIICATRTQQLGVIDNGVTLFLIDSKFKGVNCTALNTIDGVKRHRVVFDQVSVPDKHMLGELNRGWHEVRQIERWGTLAQCAEMLGGAQQVVEMAIDYAKQRIQFDRPIGQFQSVQNRLADMIIGLDGLRFLTYQAAWMLTEGVPCDKEIAITKAWGSEKYQEIAKSGGIIHGGIAATLDHDIQLYFRRAKTSESAFGDSDFHREVIASELGLKS